MKKLANTLLGLIILLMVSTACEKDEITSFEAQSAVNFVEEDTEYSFLGNTTGEYIIEVPVRIIGDSTDHDRFFQVAIINDSLTTATDDLFEIQEGVVKAGKFEGTLYVKVFNDEKLNTEKASLHLEIASSEDFRTGNVESNRFRIAWTNQVIVPSWRWYSYFFTRTPSTAAYRAVVESTGLTTFTIQDYLKLGPTGAQAMGTQFGDYVKQYNLDHPGEPLLHDDGEKAGEEIVPLYYTKSKYD